MMVLIHILAAIGSIAQATYVLLLPSKRKLFAGYGLVALTLGSGAYLVATTHARMLSVCVSGLAYVASVTVMLYAAKRKLAIQLAEASDPTH
jgi:hypothetical protein